MTPQSETRADTVDPGFEHPSPPLKKGTTAMTSIPTPRPGKYADLIPPLDARDLAALRASMIRDGWWPHMPGTMTKDGTIVTGHNRYAIAQEGGVTPHFIVVDGTDEELSYQAMVDNLARRHLNVKTRKELAAKMLKLMPEKSNRQIAAETNLSDKTVATVRAEAESRSEIPNVTERKDTRGRKTAARKPRAKMIAGGADDIGAAIDDAIARRDAEAERQQGTVGVDHDDENIKRDRADAARFVKNLIETGSVVISHDPARLAGLLTPSQRTKMLTAAEEFAGWFTDLADEIRALEDGEKS